MNARPQYGPGGRVILPVPWEWCWHDNRIAIRRWRPVIRSFPDVDSETNTNRYEIYTSAEHWCRDEQIRILHYFACFKSSNIPAHELWLTRFSAAEADRETPIEMLAEVAIVLWLNRPPPRPNP